MLSNLDVSNFKKHKQRSIDFGDGVTTIVGENASGKSSLLKGILFALFGATAAGAKDHLWNWDAEDKRSVGLALTLPEYGRVIITRTPSGARINAEDDGRLLASGTTAVTKLIEESLGMSSKDLLTLCYSKQGETQGILTMGPTALQQKVEGLAQMETVDKVMKLVSSDINRMDGKLEALNVSGIDTDKLQTQLTELEKFLTYHRIELASAESTEKEVRQELAQADEAYQADCQRRTKRDSLTNQLNVARSNLTSAKDAIGVLKDRQNQLGILLAPESMEQQITHLSNEQNKINAAVSQAESCDREIQELLKAVQIYNDKVAGHDAAVLKLAELTPQREDLQAEYNRYNDALRNAREKGSEVNKLLHEAVCPLCKREMEGVDSAQLQEEFNKWVAVENDTQVYLTDCTRRLSYLERDIRAHEAKLSHGAAAIRDEKQARLDLLVGMESVDVTALRTEYLQIAEELTKVRKDYEDLLRKVTLSEELARQIEAQQLKFSELGHTITMLESGLAEIPDVNLDAHVKNIQRLNVQLQQLVAHRQNIATNISHGESDLKATKLELERAYAVLDEYRKTTEGKANAESLDKYLRKNRNRLASHIWDGLLQYASSLVSNTTGGVLTDLDRSSGGEFLLKEDGRQIPVSEASGAQRSIVGLALRAAMTKVFYGDNLFLLLDEVTADASDETAAAIAGMLSSLNMQVVTVTHRTGEAVNAGTVIEVK
jgi:exonuclease SbcC